MAQPNPWDSYLHYMLLKKQISQTAYADNANEYAFLATTAGNILSISPNFKFQEYDIELPDANGKTEKVHFNERNNFFALMQTSFHSKDGYGIRLNQEKYMLIKYLPDSKTAYFSKKDGGACCMITKSMVVFVSYNTKIVGSDKVSQNVGQCNKAAMVLSQFLSSKGY